MNTRHWNLIQGFALAAMLPLFAACSSEGDDLLQSEEKQPVQVNITRATMNDGNDWSWQDNDQIGLNITNYGESTPNSYTLTYNNNVWTSNHATIEATLPATIQAWWPVREGVSAEKFNYDSDKIEYYEVVTGLGISERIDLSDETKYRQCDWMTIDENANQVASSSPNITLKHRLCKVTIEFIFNGWDANPTIQEIKFFAKKSNNISGMGTEENIEIIPKVIQKDKIYTAFISSYDYAGFPWLYLAQLKIEDNYYFITTSGLEIGYKGTLLQGQAYTFKVTVYNRNTSSITRSAHSECELELIEVEDMNK